MEKILTCRNLGKVYDSKTTALSEAELSLEEGKFYCVIGKSGSGKTTLLHLLAGLEKPSSGEVWFRGKELGKLSERELAAVRRKNMGFVFQDYQLLPELTVEENICLPLLLDEKKVSDPWLRTLLQSLELWNLKDRYPDQLSGGEQQRTAIGRAVVHKPDILFADEPTGNLDKRTSEEILDFLMKIHEKYNQTILLVTHDLDIARCGDEILSMEDGHLRAVMKAGDEI